MSDWEDEAPSLSVDLVEDGQKYRLTTELPGLNPEDVDISISGNTLTIKGEFTEEQVGPPKKKQVKPKHIPVKTALLLH